MTDHPVYTAGVHEYRARFDHPAGNGAEVELRVTVDQTDRTITWHVPDRPPVILDAITGRALSMLLRDGVYFSLTPDGPTVRMERDTGDGRGWVKA